MSRKGTESHEQITAVALIRSLHPGILIFAIPNGGRRGKREAARLRKEGVLAGVPDLLLPEARHPWHGLFVEMKRPGGRTVSEAQSEIGRELERRGYRVEVRDTAHGALELVDAYLRLPLWPGTPLD